MTTRFAILSCAVASLAFVSASCSSDPSNSDPSSPDDDSDAATADGRTASPDGDSERRDGGTMRDGRSTPDGESSSGPVPGPLIYSTSGGGEITSDRYRMQLNVGAPSSRGTAEGENYRIRVAPVSP
jgi:hypothetical protein